MFTKNQKVEDGMRYRILFLMALMLGSTSAAFAQTAEVTPTEEAKPTLQQRLIPESAAVLMAPVSADVAKAAETTNATTVTMASGSGTGLIIAGGALFIAGLIVGGDAGTVLAVTGAAVGAYGLYIYFR
jgi:hypothetical protein